jgi:hypothetical protein
MMNLRGIQPQIHIVAQEVILHCDRIEAVFPDPGERQPKNKLFFETIIVGFC